MSLVSSPMSLLASGPDGLASSERRLIYMTTQEQDSSRPQQSQLSAQPQVLGLMVLMGSIFYLAIRNGHDDVMTGATNTPSLIGRYAARRGCEKGWSKI
jgi:hypothetical protein